MPRAVSVVGFQLISHEKFCDAVAEEVELFSTALRGADPGTQCVTCTDWTLGDLAKHLGAVHRWAGQMVAAGSQERLNNSEVVLDRPGDPARYADWIADGGAKLVAALRAADPDAPMWSWGADKHSRFWSRRQLHETAIHRGDLEITLGRAPEYAEWVAIDGVEEFLDNLPHAKRFAPSVEKLRGDGERIGLRAGDTAWTVTLLPDRFEYARSDARTDDSGDVTVAGPPSEMYLFAWGRRKADAMTVEGDAELLARWVENSAI